VFHVFIGAIAWAIIVKSEQGKGGKEGSALESGILIMGEAEGSTLDMGQYRSLRRGIITNEAVRPVLNPARSTAYTLGH
jgi:hypothetical protein